MAVKLGKVQGACLVPEDNSVRRGTDLPGNFLLYRHFGARLGPSSVRRQTMDLLDVDHDRAREVFFRPGIKLRAFGQLGADEVRDLFEDEVNAEGFRSSLDECRDSICGSRFHD